jgi:hypothetical protein
MSALSIQPTYPIFTETDGQPLENGYIWIGTVNLDPQVNPINVYWDAALTQLAGQPIRTQGGYPVNSGTPARLYVNSDYSIRVMNKNGSTVYSAPTATERISSNLVTYEPAGVGSVPTTVEDALRQDITPQDFGASPTASAAVNAAAITAAITEAIVQGRCAVIKDVYTTNGITLPANAHLAFEGGSLIAATTGAVLTAGGNNVTIENPVIDLDSKSARGIFALSVDGFRLLGTARISNAKTGEANYNGAVQIESCTNTVVGDVIGENIRQSATLAGLYRVLEFNLCTDFSAGKIFANNCDIALNLPGSVNGFVEAVQGNDITDNVVYLLGASRNISIGDVHGFICGEGIVFNCTDLDAGIHIGSVFINTASAKGLSLRTGGGYHLGSVTLIEANMEQVTSFSPATSRMTIGSLKIYQNTATAFKPINLFGNTHITFGTIDIQANAPLSLEGGRFTDCDRIIVGSARVWGIGGAPLTIGLRFSDGGAPVANPYFFIQDYSAQNVTVPYSIGTATKTNIRILSDDKLFSNLTMQQFGGVTLQLENLNTALTAGDVLALFQAYSNDSSAPGIKFKLEVQAAGGNGGLGQTLVKNDADAVVGRVPPNAVNAGMSIKLPTSSSGLDSGMIWNNAGAVAIVP